METGIGIWYKGNEWMVLQPHPMFEFYERWDFEWKCWTIGKWTLFNLASEGWKQKV
jgi:hypothetical protein